MVIREPSVEHPWTHNAGPVLRIGNKGSGHQAHYDLKHNMFLQLTGRKRFTLCVPTLRRFCQLIISQLLIRQQSYSFALCRRPTSYGMQLSEELYDLHPRFPVSCARRLYLYPSRHALYRKSQVDFDTSVNVTLFPDFPPLNIDVSTEQVDDCTPVHVDLGPGDMLYLPPMVVHHVEALSELTMGYNVFSASTVSEGVGELSELAKVPLLHELVPSSDHRGHFPNISGSLTSTSESTVAALEDVAPGDDIAAATWLTQHCLLRLVSTVMLRYAWANMQSNWVSCSPTTSTSLLSNKSVGSCKAKHFVRDFLKRRYEPLSHEGVEIWTPTAAIALFRGYCSSSGNEGSYWKSLVRKQSIAELLGVSPESSSAEELRGTWDATCDSRTEGVYVLLDG